MLLAPRDGPHSCSPSPGPCQQSLARGHCLLLPPCPREPFPVSLLSPHPARSSSAASHHQDPRDPAQAGSEGEKHPAGGSKAQRPDSSLLAGLSAPASWAPPSQGHWRQGPGPSAQKWLLCLVIVPPSWPTIGATPPLTFPRLPCPSSSAGAGGP